MVTFIQMFLIDKKVKKSIMNASKFAKIAQKRIEKNKSYRDHLRAQANHHPDTAEAGGYARP
jgi:hypothetical protein